jgi:hypothetical protein
MTSLLGYTLSTLSPWVFAALPVALGLLVYVYRKRGESGRTIVSAIFLFEKLPRVTPARRKFVPPLRFWLELLLFALLTTAAAGLVASRSGKHVALVVDSSMSMAAKGGSGLSRLETAKRALLTDLSLASSADRFSVYSLGTTLKRVSESGIDSGGVGPALDAIQPTYTVDRVSTLVGSLLGDATYDSVWLYTDRQPGPSGDIDNQLRFITVSSPESSKGILNAWISGVSSSRVGDRSTITVVADLVGASSAQATVVADCRDKQGTSLPKASISATLGQGSPTSVSITSMVPSWAECSLALTVPEGDALSLDNVAWLVKGSEGAPIEVISSLDVKDLGLTALPNMRFARGSLDSLSPNSRALFHRITPQTVPQGPALLVYPHPGPLPWGGSVRESKQAEGKVTRWLESHPLTLYVQSDLLTLPRPRILECPDTSIPIFHTSEGIVGCAGESGGSRYAILGFELFPFDGLRNPSLSILTLNTLKWLFQGVSSAAGSRAFEPVAVPSGTVEVRYEAPLSSTLPISPQGTVYPSSPGIITFMNAAGTALGSSAVHFFAPQESNLTFDSPAEIMTTEPLASQKRDRTLPVYTWLALAALFILSLDLLARLVKRQPRGAR